MLRSLTSLTSWVANLCGVQTHLPFSEVSRSCLNTFLTEGPGSLENQNARLRGVWGVSPAAARSVLLRQPIVHQAVQDRNGEGIVPALRLSKAVEDDTGGNDKYRVERSLTECSDFTQNTLFGRIEAKIASCIEAKRARGDTSPLRILTIGPGWGCMEADLMKQPFADDIEIDTFTLTDAITPQNRTAFSSIHVGDLDTHRIPQGYDLIISVYGSFHATDQNRVFSQIFDSLNPGGEATYNYKMGRSRETFYEIQTFAGSELSKRLREVWGVDYFENRFSHYFECFAYVRKGEGEVSAAAIFNDLLAYSKGINRDKIFPDFYRIEEHGPYIVKELKSYDDNIERMIESVARSKGIEFPPSFLDKYKLDSIERGCEKWLSAGFSLRRAIEEKLWKGIIESCRR